jgi:hypothetical protein
MRDIKKRTVILFVFLALALAGCGQKASVINPLSESEIGGDCQELCSKSIVSCPSLLSKNDCEASCASWDDQAKEKISTASNCEQLGSIEEYIVSLLPKIEDPDLAPAGNDCGAACGNYVNKCLTLVPNATQALFQDGLSSCLGECASWTTAKTDCMISAIDCPSMTDVCGL